MKTKNYGIMTLVTLAVVITAGLALSPLSAQTKSSKVKIGTYDSRVVVLAYSTSDQFREKMKRESDESDVLMKSKDTVKMKEGAMKMITMSHLLERSVFTALPASFVIDLVRDKFPEIAKKAGVSMIVSKWDLNYSDPSITIIDLTDQVAALFDPEGKGAETAKEITKQAPMPADEYGLGEAIEMWEQFRTKYHIR
jgi:hypothetical protein